MIKNRKLLIVFILILTFLLAMVTYTKATDNVDELPIIDINTQNSENTANNEQENEVTNNIDNTNTNNENRDTNINSNTNAENNNVLPQTGVQGDTMLLIFIIICIVSAIYAYFKIRKYNNVN